MNTITHLRRALLAALVAPCLLLAASAEHVEAQVMQLDEGTFEILRAGARVGTETFTIRRIGVGPTATIVLQGRTSVSGAEIEPILETSTEWVPIQYRRTLSGERDEVVELITDGQRYTAITTNERGEGEREFRGGTVTAVLDAEVAFLYHAVAARSDADVLTVLHPDQGRQARFRIEVVGNEGYRLGDATVQVRRVRISAGEDVRDILVDDRNRVMSVQIPGRDWVARRLPG
jgi:hypothetical protein